MCGWAARCHIGAEQRRRREALRRALALTVMPVILLRAVGKLLLALLLAPFAWGARLAGAAVRGAQALWRRRAAR